MTDAHCHVSCGDPSVRELLIGRDFVGIHPWETLNEDEESQMRNEELLSSILTTAFFARHPLCRGIGEIGLDRLKDKAISPRMRDVFARQLRFALTHGLPVILHGAKCWGQLVDEVKSQTARPSNSQALLFHGFSRSDGLIPDIVKLDGYISVGPAVLNDHAVNYRELVKKIPLDRLLVETDRTEENAATCPSIGDVLAKTAELRGISAEELVRITDANVGAFLTSRSEAAARS